MIQINFSLPDGCLIRPATAQDVGRIRRLVLSAMLDPTQLRWSQFWVIDCQGNLVACGQLRSFQDAQELGSLVVDPAWRGRGFGKALTRHLIQEATQPLYLECLGDRLYRFYSNLGFVSVDRADLPRSLKQKFGLSQRLAQLLHIRLFLMKYPVVNDCI